MGTGCAHQEDSPFVPRRRSDGGRPGADDRAQRPLPDPRPVPPRWMGEEAMPRPRPGRHSAPPYQRLTEERTGPRGKGGREEAGRGKGGGKGGVGAGHARRSAEEAPPLFAPGRRNEEGRVDAGGLPPGHEQTPGTCRAGKTWRSAWKKQRSACGSWRGRGNNAPSSASLTLSPYSGGEGTALADGDARRWGPGPPTGAGGTTGRRASRRWCPRRQGGLRLRGAQVRSRP